MRRTPLSVLGGVCFLLLSADGFNMKKAPRGARALRRAAIAENGAEARADSGADGASPEEQSRKHFIKNIIDEDLESGRHGAVCTRFPPEPNGYLHLGHAKSINLNFGLGREYSGTTHMRFDDTNPLKEDVEYINAILEDVRWLNGASEGADPWSGEVRYSSSYFSTFYEAAEFLIEQGLAYVDTLSPELMREYRGTLTSPGRDSPDRSRPVEENLSMFRAMRDGTMAEGSCVLRAKIDMASPNMNLRDPTIYRVRHASHPVTKDAWKIYPMYDFAHCISDALEGITHSICTLEFQDHRPLYDWFLEKLMPSGLLPQRDAAQLPRQYEFSRLNLAYTVLSKRKLIQLVEQGTVDGWDDPRMPTVCGLRRRGFAPSALRLFCERVGISKADSVIDASVLEDCARADLDASAPRAFALQRPLKVTLSNWEGGEEVFEVPRHPKREDMGVRSLSFGGTLSMEREDFSEDPPKGFNRLTPGGRVRLKYAYVIECEEVLRDADGNVEELVCRYLPDTRAGNTPEGMKKVRGIVQWLGGADARPASLRLYDRLFRAADPGAATGDFMDDINERSLEVLDGAMVEPRVLEDLAAGERLRYQFERIGYFYPDEEEGAFNRIVTLRDTWQDAAPQAPPPKEDRFPYGGDAKAQRSVPDAQRVEFRVGTVISCEAHPDAEALLVSRVDVGEEEPRTIVSGLAEHYAPAELEGKGVVVVANLKPAKMRGVQSAGMILAASEGDAVRVLGAPEGAAPGERLAQEGADAAHLPDALLKSEGQQKVWKRVVQLLATDEEGNFVLDGKVMAAPGGSAAVAEFKGANVQ